MLDHTIIDILQEQFFVNGQKVDQSGVPYRQLLDEKVMQQLITSRTTQFSGTDHRVGGANIMKWFGNFITAHAYLYSIHDSWLSYDDFSFVEKGKKAEIQLIEPHLVALDETNRENMLIERLEALFKMLQPIFERVASTSGLPIQQVCGLLSNPFYNQYQAWMNISEADEQLKLNDDLQLMRKLDPTVFGLNRNPFDVTFRYVDSWWEPVEPVRIKAACCMSYLKGEGNYCFACPKMNKKERVKRAEQLRREQQQS
ncbi:hypothetical protein IQ10_01850 [Halalkalibacter nanhaiisediminis]|uniref:Ferric iron reductase protein FhuF n=1 Tax=Halalkalibacter nanhaiisediminis TaxID=688079 RepID=A0A562QM70_9BACI|nr:hypothetical protein IQ10_01850 [Halalkalibacter nanhaiisediminis]